MRMSCGSGNCSCKQASQVTSVQCDQFRLSFTPSKGNVRILSCLHVSFHRSFSVIKNRVSISKFSRTSYLSLILRSVKVARTVCPSLWRSKHRIGILQHLAASYLKFVQPACHLDPFGPVIYICVIWWDPSGMMASLSHSGTLLTHASSWSCSLILNLLPQPSSKLESFMICAWLQAFLNSILSR